MVSTHEAIADPMNKTTTAAIAIGAVAWLLWPKRASAAEPVVDPPIPEGEPPPEDDLPGVSVHDDPPPTFTDFVEPDSPFTTVEPSPAVAVPVLSEIERSEPTPGYHYQVKRGDTFLGTGPNAIVHRALLAAARDAGIDPVRASAIANNPRARMAYLDLILCSGPNDALYGTYSGGAQTHTGPHGRTITLLPIHADNRTRVGGGRSPLRNVKLGTPADRRHGTAARGIEGGHRSFEWLLLPAIDPQKLRQGVISADGITWSDGSPSMWDHPAVSGLGIEVLEPAAATFGRWGCGEGTMDL